MRWLSLFTFLTVISSAHAAPAPEACQNQFYENQMPDLVIQSDRLHVLCFGQFAVEESGVTKTPLWSAEHLTAERIKAAKAMTRKNAFHPQLDLPLIDRANLSDYKQSGYDRGHMSPNDDMPDGASAYESFSLANMVPQNPCNNEIIWKAIEDSVRSYVSAHEQAYIITGPIFDDPTKTIGADQVHVPTRLFKAVYDPIANALIIVVTKNENTQTYQVISMDELQAATGISILPTVKNPLLLTLPPLPHLTGNCKKESSME